MINSIFSWGKQVKLLISVCLMINSYVYVYVKQLDIIQVIFIDNFNNGWHYSQKFFKFINFLSTSLITVKKS